MRGLDLDQHRVDVRGPRNKAHQDFLPEDRSRSGGVMRGLDRDQHRVVVCGPRNEGTFVLAVGFSGPCPGGGSFERI